MGERTLREFSDHVDRGDLVDDIKIVYRVSGGMPHESHEPAEEALVEEELEEFRLSGGGTADVVLRRSTPEEIPTRVLSTELDRAESQELFRRIKSGLNGLVPRSEARFLPDSLIGSITVEVGGEAETFYFLADEEERISQDKPVAPEIIEAVRSFEEISRRSREPE